MNCGLIFSLIWLSALAACGAAPAERAPDNSGAAPPPASSVKRTASVHDWTRFGWDVGRSSASTDETGITAANVATLRRQQVTLDGTVDASPIYLHGVKVNGGTHDVFLSRPLTGRRWRSTPTAEASSGASRRADTIRGRDRGESRIRHRLRIPTGNSSTPHRLTGTSRRSPLLTATQCGARRSPLSLSARRSRRP